MAGNNGRLNSLRPWESLVAFRPHHSVILNHNEGRQDWHLHRLESAHGPINLDYYPVHIRQLPLSQTPEEFLASIRKNFNAVLSAGVVQQPGLSQPMAEFKPYDAADAERWNSDNPRGAVISIDMRTPFYDIDLRPEYYREFYWNLESGSVVVSESSPTHFRFSTIWTTDDWAHPVSGTREFGVVPQGDGSVVFYTRGADRPTGYLDAAASSAMFQAADGLWQTLQRGVHRYVEAAGGCATIEPRVFQQHDWPDIAQAFFHPNHPNAYNANGEQTAGPDGGVAPPDAGPPSGVPGDGLTTAGTPPDTTAEAGPVVAPWDRPPQCQQPDDGLTQPTKPSPTDGNNTEPAPRLPPPEDGDDERSHAGGGEAPTPPWQPNGVCQAAEDAPATSPTTMTSATTSESETAPWEEKRECKADDGLTSKRTAGDDESAPATAEPPESPPPWEESPQTSATPPGAISDVSSDAPPADVGADPADVTPPWMDQMCMGEG